MSKAKAQARNQAYQRQFNLPEDEILVDEFNCALQQKILLQGKLYISQNFACFYSNIFGNETIKILPASDITGVKLAKILFIPNSIKVFLTYETYFFASFLHRDDAYRLLTKISRGESIAQMGSFANDTAATADEGSDGEDNSEDSRGSSAVRSPGGTSKVRHASMLSNNALRLKAENDRKRQEELQDARRKMKQPTPRHPDDVGSDEEAQRSDQEEEDEPPRRTNGKAAAASGKRAPARKQSSDGEASDNGSPELKPRGGGKHAKKPSRDYEDEELLSPEEEEEREPTPPPRKKGAKGGKSSSSAYLDACSQSSWSLPSSSQQKIAKIYDPELLKTVDPAVIEAAGKFKNKKLGLDAPESKRRMCFQGAMKRQGGWSVVDRWAFLFSDFFLFTEYDAKKGTNYVEKQKVLLQNLLVDMRPPAFQADSLKKTKLPNAFRLLDNATPPCQYVCSTLTTQEKWEWGKKFTEAISRWHANPLSKSTVDRTKVGWYTQFVRGLLPYAVIQSDTDLLENLVRTPQKDSINDLDQEGYSLLHLCVLNNTPKLIPILLSHGSDLRLKDFDGFTPLHTAIIAGNIPCIQALMQSKLMDISVWHPIHAKEGKFLREKSALWLAALVHYQTAPATADTIMRLLVNSVKAMPAFLDERSEKNDMTLLDYCCFNPGMVKVAQTAIDLGATIDLPNLEGLTPLIQACKAGNLRMVTLLLQSGAQPNLRSDRLNLNSAIFYCRGGSGLDCARELVCYGARWQDMKNRDGTRVKDVFTSISQQNFLKQSEEVYQQQKPSTVDNKEDQMKKAASSATQNNRHDFESCCLCQTEFTLVNKREYCRRCGWNICLPCSTKKMNFLTSSKGRSKNAASSGGMRERVCDGCYNLVSHRKKKKKPAADEALAAEATALEDEVDPAFRKPKKKPAAGGSDDDDASPPGGKSTRPTAKSEQSGFKSIKRLDIDSDEDGPAGENGSNGKSPASLDADSPNDDSDNEDAKAKAKLADQKQKAEGEKKSGGFMSSLFGRKPDPVAQAKAEAEKHAKLAKQKGRDSEEEDDNFEDKKKKKPTNGTSTAATNGKGKGKPSADDDEEDDVPAPTKGGKTTSAAAAAATKKAAASGNAVLASIAARNAPPPKENEDSDSDAPPRRAPGWSSRAPPPPDSDPEHTDSDAAETYSDDGAEPLDSVKKEKGNFLQRGFKSATGLVQKAGNTVVAGAKSAAGGVKNAAVGVAKGVKSAATSVQEKITAVAVPVDRRQAEEDEDSDPAVAQKERRRQAARERLKKKREENPPSDDEEEEERPAKGNAKAASTIAKMGDAKKQAQRNQDLLYQLEDKGGEVEDGGREFASLTGQLKSKSKKGML